jgi:hypothetical protein
MRISITFGTLPRIALRLTALNDTVTDRTTIEAGVTRIRRPP